MFEQIAANKRRSVVLVVGMALLLFALGWFGGAALAGGDGTGAGGYVGLFLAAVIWLVLTLVAYFQGDQVFLRIAGARRIEKEDLPVLWNVVEEMTIASGLGRMPAVYVIDDPAPNAFATGRKPENAAVAVTSGLLRALSRDELQGVVAHEIGHIRNRDILLMLYAGVLAGAIVLIAEVGLRSFLWGGRGRSRRSSGDGGGGQAQALIMIVAIVLMILAPIVAQLIYFAISRKREYLADATAAVYTRYPEGLASALEKIAAAPQKLASANKATAPMYIVNPLARRGAAAADLTATHPPISQRVKILRSMTQAGWEDYDASYRAVSGKEQGVLPPSAYAGAGLRVGKAAADYRRERAATGAAGAAAAAGTAGAAAGDRAAADGERAAASGEPAAVSDRGTDRAAILASGAGATRGAAGGSGGGDTPAVPADGAEQRDAVRHRAREVDDFFYREQGYRRLQCPCDAVLKVPPGFTASRVRCPRCGREHAISAFGEFPR
ncbi:MAG: M48 family metallopeptidase [Candidatus Krumholzibacteriia bacterium]